MKKALLTLVLATISFSFAANAQEETKKTDGIGLAVELQVVPNMNGANWFRMDGIRARYTLGNGDNVRLNLGFNRRYDNGKAMSAVPVMDDYPTVADYNLAQEYYEHNLNDFNKNTWGNFTIGLGYEHFFVKEGRLRPYTGCGFNLTWNFAKSHSFDEYDVVDGTNIIWYTTDIVTSGRATNPSTGAVYNKSFAWGLNVFTGADFYIYKGLYIGAELNLGASFTYNGKIVRTTTNDNPALTAERIDEFTNNAASSTLNYSVIPMLRFGWEF